MSGNPMGLAGISHYGTMQRVGGKAAGFINKKFFHPSSLRNQEKLWVALTADEAERKKQDEMDKRRDEEKQVEELRKQMYLAGQATRATDSLGLASFKGSGAPQNVTKDQRDAFEQQKQRRLKLKQERANREAAEDDGSEADEALDFLDETQLKRLSEEEMLEGLAKSKYRENAHVQGHVAVWGSWWEEQPKPQGSWGFRCCKTLDRNKRCPLAPEEEVKNEAAKADRGTRGKRRRRGRGQSGGDIPPDLTTQSAAASSPDPADLAADTFAAAGNCAEAVDVEPADPPPKEPAEAVDQAANDTPMPSSTEVSGRAEAAEAALSDRASVAEPAL